MSDWGYTNRSTGYIEGYVSKDPTRRESHDSAWESVKDIDRKQAISKINPVYGRTIYELNARDTGDLEPLQKLVLAYGGTAPFGGTVRNNTVEVYND